MKKIGYAICGSFCTHKRSIKVLEALVKEFDVVPILSERVVSTDTRFGNAADFIEKVEKLCDKKIISTVEDAEPLGPAIKLDMLVISPCTGNTLAKIANSVTDSSVTMATKAQLRGNVPIIIALASNDALGLNLKNISELLCKKNIYFVPMVQDDVEKKPHSLVCDFSKIRATMELAWEGKQIQPIFVMPQSENDN